ncbi:MAG: CDP-alcohol phosphatidyltransferase family protein [Pseudomonadota bacterium]
MSVLRWIPNIISLLRIALVPMVVASIATERYTLGVSLFMLAGFSDGLDGWLARRFNWRTALGAILDPIADKLLLIGTFVVLASVGIVPLRVAILVVARDLIIMGGAITYHFLYGDLEGKPTILSKVNTLLLLVYVVALLLLETGRLGISEAMSQTIVTSLTLALLFTLTVSTAHYMREWITRAREHRV